MLKKLTVLLVTFFISLCAFGADRSSKWQSVRKHYMLTHSRCAVCGGTKFLEVHHVKPFHLNPALELDESNLITLCDVVMPFGGSHHLTFGHGGNFKKENPNVREDAKHFHDLLMTPVPKTVTGYDIAAVKLSTITASIAPYGLAYSTK